MCVCEPCLRVCVGGGGGGGGGSVCLSFCLKTCFLRWVEIIKEKAYYNTNGVVLKTNSLQIAYRI